MSATGKASRQWDALAFDRYLKDGLKRERSKRVPMRDRLFRFRKVAEACDASVETLRKWRTKDRPERPDIDQYERLLVYFDVPDKSWLK